MAGVVDQRVEPAVFLRERRGKRADAVEIGQIQHHQVKAAPVHATQLAQRRLRARFAAAGENHGRAEVGELPRRRLADAGIRARDDDDFPL